MERGRIIRVVRRRAPSIRVTVDGMPIEAQEGESVLVAVLASGGRIRTLEFNGESRAGFCLMGACQDCWVRLGDGQRVRACTTRAIDGMAILTGPSDA
jgi:NADH dehydrogenase/NADH:ubiquinone oxidoreductase subunit G